MPMDQEYEFAVSEPGDRLSARISNFEGSSRVFDASLSLRRRELSRANMTRVLIAYPPSTIATVFRIYANAARLKLKGAPHHRRPRPA